MALLHYIEPTLKTRVPPRVLAPDLGVVHGHLPSMSIDDKE